METNSSPDADPYPTQELIGELSRRAKRIAMTVSVLVVVFLVGGAITGMGLTASSPLLALWFMIGSTTLAVATIANLIVGSTVKDLNRKFQEWILVALLRRAHKEHGVGIDKYETGPGIVDGRVRSLRGWGAGGAVALVVVAGLLLVAWQVTEYQHRPGRTFRDCDSCPRMAVVPAGTFEMGSPASEEERFEFEGPLRDVNIATPFAVGVYEVTFEEWNACYQGGVCRRNMPNEREEGDRHPVIDVSWADTQEYVEWLSRETGEEYRLLSEAEWEYAARAGTATARHWGESSSSQCDYANGNTKAADGKQAVDDPTPEPCCDVYVATAPVGQFRSNAWGLYDMLGNVSEWTEDCWNESYLGAPSDGSAWRDGDCSERVFRGGAWGHRPRLLRSAFRFHDQIKHRNNGVGFRVARAINES